MENIPIPENEVSTPSQNNACINCGSAEILEGYPNKLCKECREKFIKFPIPLWVKAFGGGIAILVLFSFYYVPANFFVGIHLEKGIKAEKAKNYLTAEKEFKKVASRMPDNLEANAHLFIASFYNDDYETMISTSQLLVGKNVDDEELFSKVDGLLSAAQKYFSSDSLEALHSTYKESKDTIPNFVYEDYIHRNGSDVNAEMEYAGILFAEGKYNKCDSLLQQILIQDNEYAPALTLLSSSKRYQKQPDSALVFIEKLLSLNKQNVYALSSKARAFLMLKKDKEAKEIALNSYQLDESNGYSLSTLAIAYHYNNDLKQRDKLVKKAQESKDSSTQAYFQYALDIISSKEKLRD